MILPTLNPFTSAFIYPRKIVVYRHATTTAASGATGPQTYRETQTTAGVAIWVSAPILKGVSCSIQERNRGIRPETGLPGSEVNIAGANIFIALGVVSAGAIKVRDYVLDDLGIKYQIVNPYYDSLGYRLYCEILEA